MTRRTLFVLVVLLNSVMELLLDVFDVEVGRDDVRVDGEDWRELSRCSGTGRLAWQGRPGRVSHESEISEALKVKRGRQ